MAKRKKNRTHKIRKDALTDTSKSPKSFVIKSTRAHHVASEKHTGTRASHHSTSLDLLVKDFRKLMEPNTASNLRERKSNRFKDFLAMAGPLSVSHILVFSQSNVNSQKDDLKDSEIISSINLKIYKVPRGPTLTFKVLRYSLMIDILNSTKHPRSPGAEYKTEPLLIMNNFNPGPTTTNEEANQLQLLTTTFRNLFPQIKVHEIQLVQTRRVVLLSYNSTTRTIDLRHYLITVKPIGVSKKIIKLVQGINNSANARTEKQKKTALNLSNVEDVADYILGRPKAPGSVASASSGGFTGAASEITDDGDRSDYDGISSEGEDESEAEDNARKVELPQNYLGRGNFKNTKKAIKLREIGPRLELGLIKIEQGLGTGDILYHEFIKKSKEEDVRIKQKVKEREKLRAQRKKEQEENVKRKKMEKEAKKEAKVARKKVDEIEQNGKSQEQEGNQEEEDDDDEEVEEEESEIEEDAELSDIYSELAFSDNENDLLESEEHTSTDVDSDHIVNDTKTSKSRTNRKKVKFDHQLKPS
ncbi:hypothetical protein O181_005979 [Austropuccinia psidii MF-1]|uniref:Brix domain-containing protein n=1 Tax=Austropuccinia psidii MF-1 TaxID=1389203 RepID=A0A9Q3BJ65_9BASI|nr:hypothetical protein [Austropuccinia psidii MF-1]